MAFVGRERELGRLAAGLERAAGGGPVRIALTGPAGVGISRLLDEIEVRLRDVAEVTVLRGAAFAPLSGMPYAPLADALRSVLIALPDGPLQRVVGLAGQDLGPLLPELRGRLGALAEPTMLVSPDQRAARMAEGLIGLIDRLAGSGAVLLAIEDLHWADPGTLRLVSTLLRVSRRVPLCLVLTYRPHELHRRHAMRALADAIEADRDVEHIELPALERREVAALLEAVIAERPTGGLVAAAMEASLGNPLLVEQLAAARAVERAVRLSDPFEETVRARLAPLSPGAVRCLRLLAAGRRPLPIEAVRRAALPGGPLPFPLIEEAVRSGLARRDGDGRLGLIHDRYAEAIEALSLPTERQPVHAALAAALDGRPAEQAWHWEAAMRFGAARDAHVAAGREARAIDPGATALSHFVRGLELLDARDPGAAEPRIDQAELLVEASEAAFAADQPRRAAGLIGQAIGAPTFHDVSGSAVDEPAPPQRRQVAVAVLHRQLGRYLAAAGDGPGSIRSLEAAAEAAPPDAARERGRILGLLAQQLMLDGRFADSAHVAERARVAVRDQPDASAELSHATCTLAVDRGYLGDVDAGLVLLAEAEALASRAGRLDDLMRACANRTHLLEMDARLEAALSAVQDGIAACRRYGVEAVYGAFLRGNAADILFRLGRWSEAEAECRAALEWSTSRLAWSPLLALAGILVESQADEEARRTVGQILLQLEAVPEGQWTAALQRAAVSFALWRNDLADALRSAREGWQRVLETHELRQVALAASTTLEACAAVSDAARSRREVAAVVAAGQLGSSVLAAAARTVGGVVGPPGAAREARLHLETARAHGGRLRGRYDPAAWAHLAVEWAELGMPYLTAKCRWWQAAALLQARASRTEARDALLEAWSLAHTLSARPLLTELERLAGRARIALPSATSNRAAGAATQTAGVDDRSTQPTEPAHAGGPGRRPELVRQPEPAGLVQLIRANAARPLGRPGAGSGQRRRVDRGEALAGLTDRLLRSDVPVRDPFNLSPREFEVLSIIVEGRTNREIAERLFISERTVGVHVRNILAKLDVSGRIEAANVAIRLGLVPVPSTVRLLPSA